MEVVVEEEVGVELLVVEEVERWKWMMEQEVVQVGAEKGGE